ncbi:hypothetical protein BBP00_00003151 [Phytophthora kernoviae]|uniref:Anoctamin transmembrane domain-containing protein n=1 Tax=Phytophthora kernoviae TaxID=325452 RepID=A0A3F2RW75_9STRA|nr:hypothetical protein BBP00_00003151 [Phytophthora kernoviae]
MKTELPVNEHSIQVDIISKQKSASIFHKNGAVSDVYENTMFDHDLVMIFPRREGGETKKPDAFTVQAFVNLLLGEDNKRSRNMFQRVLRTPRCFLDDHGNDLMESMSDEVGDLNRSEIKRKLLEAEYETFVGSMGPTTERCFCELVATAISRRVQLACGLTTRMFVSCDGDEIIMTVKSENDDLRVEADRTNYRLQLSNKPFDAMLHAEKIRSLQHEVGPDGWQKSMDHLQDKRGTAGNTTDVPEMDPKLFRGTTSYHPVTDVKVLTYEDRSKRHRWFVVSVTVVTVMVGIVIVALFGLFVLKHVINDQDYLTKRNIDTKYQTPLTLSVTVANAIQILILNTVYRLVARKLNDLENHRTDGEYENYLAIKVFLFQFCNSFASFFYIAFIKRSAEGSCLFGDNCMKELRDQLLVLFLVRIVVGNTMEVVVPYLKHRYQLYAEVKTPKDQDKKTRHNFIEIQAKLLPYESNEAFEDFNELAIQYGFHSLFVVAFPLTPLLALVNNIVELHVDASKLCFSSRRPFPSPAKDIGVWFYILRFMTYVTVGTNAALILWTSDLFEDTSGTVKAFGLVLAWQVGLAASLVIERTVPDTPHVVSLLLERYDYIVDVVFKNLSEGDVSHLNEVSENLDLTIYPNDQWEENRDGD